MKKVTLLLILILSTITISAQDVNREQPGRRTTFTQNHFWDNWFVGAGVGANMNLGKGHGSGFFKRQTVTGNFQVGKWINPYLGLRLKGTAGKVHTFDRRSDHSTMMNRHTMATGEVDVMFDLVNFFGDFKEDRVYGFIPYAGIGGAYGRGHSITTPSGKHHEKSLTINAGLINSFNINKHLAVQLEVSAVALKDGFDRRKGKRSFDVIGNASANIIYKFGKNTTKFSQANLMDQGLVDNLNDEINRLRGENDILSKRPEFCPECPEVPAPKVVEVHKGQDKNAIFFRIGSAKIENNQEPNIFNIAKYLQENPNVKVQVVGYADKNTGTSSYNKQLSEKRAKAVSDLLVKKYNINSNRVSIDWKGDSKQPYSTNAWNRVVLVISAQ